MNVIKKTSCARTLVAAITLATAFAATAKAQESFSAKETFDGQAIFRVHSYENAPETNLMVATSDISSSNSLMASNEIDPSTLPDAPSATLRGSYIPPASVEGAQNRHTIVAPIYTAYIPAGWTAQPLTGRDKVILGLRDSVSPFSFIAIIASAGYSHVTNGQPNYGTDKGAFGQRLGATAIRDTMENVLTDSVFAPILREDPRYYVEGNQYNFFHRVIYAGTRPIITRTDSGHQTLNGALLLGYAAGSAASYAYYPAINQNFKDTAATFGGSLAGAAIGDLVSEFSDEVLIKLHLKKAQ